MDKITLIKCEDGAIWVTTEEDQIGKEFYYDINVNEKAQFIISLANFLGYDPTTFLDIV